MSTQPIPDIAPLPDYLQTHGPATLNSIREARKATVRGKSAWLAQYENTAVELQSYLYFAAFDISCRIGEVERYLKSKERAETTPPEILEQIAEALRELKLCSDIGNFAIGQQLRPN
jgi:O-succinylbenzoate synthase